ncbi:MAG: type IV secretory system conjugative DNA transfer family protein [Actinomycetaceae bacterium]|nr:type IV secretory system conjugative DNA transfer family protein [Actinomycetaceae bacterium]
METTNYIAHATTDWPLLTAQLAATKQAARLSGWVQEAERLHVWETDQMLPIAPVPTFGFKENDKPALFTAGNRVPPPPVSGDIKLAASGVQQARLESLHDCALTYGVRQGMREQMARIQRVLGREDVAKMMDDAFDFAPVMLTRYLVPPSVTESRDEFELQNAGMMRLREARYHVVTQARFSPVRPNWRGFMHQIFVSEDERSPCNAQAFGLSPEEISWWNRAEAASRSQGIEAANLVFHNSLERLANTYTGMLKYHEWSWRGLIDIPQIAQSRHILTLDPKSQDARLHERLLRVTHLPRFSDSRKRWEAGAPHMEESKAVAIDLALPVCSGEGCTNDRFAFGGLRHAASEDYFIHPTLVLRGAGGHKTRQSALLVQAIQIPATSEHISTTEEPRDPTRRDTPYQQPTVRRIVTPTSQNNTPPKPSTTVQKVIPVPSTGEQQSSVAPSPSAGVTHPDLPQVEQNQLPKDFDEHTAPTEPEADPSTMDQTDSVPTAEQVTTPVTQTPQQRSEAASAAASSSQPVDAQPVDEQVRASALERIKQMDERNKLRIQKAQEEEAKKRTSAHYRPKFKLPPTKRTTTTYPVPTEGQGTDGVVNHVKEQP